MSSQTSAPYRFPLGIDPLRLLLALRDHWFALLAIVALTTAGGSFLGYREFKKPHYTATATLQKSPSTSSEHYSPEVLEEESLKAIAFGPKVLGPLGRDLTPPQSISQLREVLEVTYAPEQNAFTLIARAPNEDAAVDLANRWSREFVRASTGRQQEHAKQREAQLKEDLASLQQKLDSVHEQVATLAQREKVVNDTSSTTAIYADILALETSLRDYQLKRETFVRRQERAVTALLERHPRRMQLSKETQELARLQARYTEKSPLVKNQQAIISEIQAKIDAELQGEPTEAQLKACLQVAGGEVFYQNYMTLKDEELVMEKGKALVETTLAAKRAEMARLPEISNQFKELNDQREILSAQRSLLEEQASAASAYARHPQGYVREFQEAVLGLSLLSTGNLKTGMSALGAALLGLSLAFLYALIRELCVPEMRTMLQAAITTRATPKLWVSQSDPEEEEAKVREFWLTELAHANRNRRRILFPIVGDLRAEFVFWKTLLQSIKHDNEKALFIDVAQEPVPDSFLKANMLPFSTAEREPASSSAFLQAGSPSEDIWEMTDGSSLSASTVTATTPEVSALAVLPKLVPTDRDGDDQPLVPLKRDPDTSTSARYVSAADYSTEQLIQLLRELPSNYYVICRWAIGPTSSLTKVANSFDQHFLLNSPQSTSRSVAASQSRIFRSILGESNGLLLLNEPCKNFMLRLVHWLENGLLNRARNNSPQSSAAAA